MMFLSSIPQLLTQEIHIWETLTFLKHLTHQGQTQQPQPQIQQPQPQRPQPQLQHPQPRLLHPQVVNGVLLTRELQTLLYRLLLTMLVGLEVQTAQQYNQEQAVIIRTLSAIMLLMHSMTTTRRIQHLPAVYLEEQHLLQAMIQVRISSYLKA